MIMEADGVSKVTVRIEPLTEAGVAPAVELAVRVLRVKPGDRGEQFAADIAGEQRQMFVAKANGQLVGYGRILELAAEEAGPGTPAGYYLGGVLVDPAWRGRGIAPALTRARLGWAFARTDTVSYVTGADNTASLRLHAGPGVPGNQALQQQSVRSGGGRAVAAEGRWPDPDVRPCTGTGKPLTVSTGSCRWRPRSGLESGFTERWHPTSCVSLTWADVF